MANPQHLAMVQQGKRAWDSWITGESERGRGFVDLSGARFTDVDFKGFYFPGQADFSECVFEGSADFHGANFCSSVDFHRAQFLCTAGFASCHFGGDASFTKARFEGDAWFTDAYFRSQAWFEHTVFEDDFEAAEALFGSDARFAEAQFIGRAWFHDAKFERSAWFNAAVFRKDVRFVRTRFEGAAEEFSDAKFAMAPDFRAARFQVQPTLQRAVVGYTIDGSGSRWRRFVRCAVDNSQAPSYRRLKQLASEAKDHERELQFFALEMRAKRFYEVTAFWPLVLNIAYDWLSDYGRSIARPLAWWAAVVLMSTVVVFSMTLALGPMAIFERGGAALVVAITNSGLLIGADKWLLRLEAVERLCPSCQGKFGLMADSLFYLQSGMSLLFVFLIGLALRNRFRIGGTS